MRKLTEDFRLGLLGAAAGLFSSSVMLLIERIDTYYASLSPKPITEDQFCGTDFIRELWWIPPAFWHVLLSVVASFLVHRYLANRLRSPFLLWQVVGLTTVLGWGLSFFLLGSLQCVMRGSLDPLEPIATSTELAYLAKYVSVAFACNVFYGSVVNASSRQYVEQFESD